MALNKASGAHPMAMATKERTTSLRALGTAQAQTAVPSRERSAFKEFVELSHLRYVVVRERKAWSVVAMPARGSTGPRLPFKFRRANSRGESRGLARQSQRVPK